jgi:hemoglobin
VVQRVKTDISKREDIELLVRGFYKKAFQDDLIAHFFIGMDLEFHLPHMISFWSFVLLDESGYTTNVVAKHTSMKINESHVDRWVLLFSQCVDDYFKGEKATFAKERAGLIGWTILSKIAM